MNKKILIIICSILIISSIGLIIYKKNQYQKAEDEQRLELDRKEKEEINLLKKLEEKNNQSTKQIRENQVNRIREKIEVLYNNNLPRTDITNEEIVEIDNLISTINYLKESTSLQEELNNIKTFKAFYEAYINTYNNTLLPKYEEYYTTMMNNYNELLPAWKAPYEKDINDIKDQKRQFDNALTYIDVLYSKKYSSIKNNVNHNEIDSALNITKNLPDSELKTQYLSYVNKANKTLIQREEEAKRQKEIDDAWVIVDTPYISQNQNKVYNGCEVTSLLMALQYKGYLRDKTIFDIAEAVPKSDDPHQGFTDDIYSLYPTYPPHWIAPDALSKFGREYSGNQNVIDATGYTFNQLLNELKNGNPVVIYLTSKFLSEPIWKGELEIPSNLHVMLFVGYNPVSNEAIISDPWTKADDSKRKHYSLSRVSSIYNQVGQKAVIVR